MSRKYKLNGYVTISIYTEVEADSLEEAIRIAKSRDVGILNYGWKGRAKDVWVADEYDGLPQKITEDKV